MHTEIRDLKSHNWYTQNPVASILTSASLNDAVSDLLSTYHSRFYAIPGKIREISIDVSTKINDKEEYKVLGVYFSGHNILRPDEGFSLYEEENGGIPYEGIRGSALERRISEEL